MPLFYLNTTLMENKMCVKEYFKRPAAVTELPSTCCTLQRAKQIEQKDGCCCLLLQDKKFEKNGQKYLCLGGKCEKTPIFFKLVKFLLQKYELSKKT